MLSSQMIIRLISVEHVKRSWLSTAEPGALYCDPQQGLPCQGDRQIGTLPRLENGVLEPLQRSGESLRIPALDCVFHQLAARKEDGRSLRGDRA